MIDPITAFSAITAAHATLKKCCEMGKDLSSAQSAIMKYANAEAELQVGATRAKKKRFGSLMDNAIEQHFKEEEQKRMKDELRSMFMLYGSAGQWERLQSTIAHARAEKKKQLEAELHKRDLIRNTAIVSTIVIVGSVSIFFWVRFLQGTLN